jgi:uncharacterized DUF497 family protein
MFAEPVEGVKELILATLVFNPRLSVFIGGRDYSPQAGIPPGISIRPDSPQTPALFSLATERPEWYNSHIRMRFSFDSRKSRRLRANPRRGIGFEEARELFSKPYWLDRRSDVPEQFLAVGWVGDRLYSVIFEVREDEEGEILHLVTLWRSTKEEVRLYEENS